MPIHTPCELGVGKPLIGSNHMHSIACREGDETSMLVERNIPRPLATSEGRDVMAFVCERLQMTVTRARDDDSAMVIYTQPVRTAKLASRATPSGAEHEQERAIDQRQYLHSMIVGITDDDSMSIIVDRNTSRIVELARLISLLAADREQEREIDRRQEHQSIVAGIDDDDAMVMLVDRNASRIVELEIS